MDSVNNAQGDTNIAKQDGNDDKNSELPIYPLYGVEVNWVDNFFNSDRIQNRVIANNGDFTTGDIVSDVIDITKDDKTSLAVYLKRKEPEAVKDVADYFVSHAWRYQLKDLIESIKELKRKQTDPSKNLYVWLDVFTVNQHDPASHTTKNSNKSGVEFLKETFHTALQKIGKTALVLYPYNDPIALKRSWCLWEIYGTSLYSQLDVIVVPSQVSLFRQALLNDVNQLTAYLSKIDASKAESLKKEDQESILAAANSVPGGVISVQESAVGPLRRWMTDQALGYINEIEKAEQVNEEELAVALNQVSLLLGQQGDFERQEQFCLRALEIRNRISDEISEPRAAVLCNLATAYQNRGKFDDSLAYFKLSIEVFKQIEGTLGKQSVILNNIGDLLQNFGRYKEAETYLQESLQIKEELGVHDVATKSSYAKTTANLAGVKFKLGDYAGAEQLYKKALDLYHEIYGPKHQDVATQSNNLAIVLGRLNRLEEAEKFYLQALEIGKITYGPNHGIVGTTLGNLGLVYNKMGKFDKAEEYYREAMQIHILERGEESVQVSIDKSNLANLLKERGKTREAVDMMKESLHAMQKCVGETHPDSIIIMGNLANLLPWIGDYAEAERLLRKALVINKSIYGENVPHEKVAGSLHNLGMTLRMVNKTEEANKYGKEAAVMFEQVLGPNHPNTLLVKREWNVQ